MLLSKVESENGSRPRTQCINFCRKFYSWSRVVVPRFSAISTSTLVSDGHHRHLSSENIHSDDILDRQVALLVEEELSEVVYHYQKARIVCLGNAVVSNASCVYRGEVVYLIVCRNWCHYQEVVPTVRLDETVIV